MPGIVKKDLTYYAKILFFISIALLFYGIILSVYGNYRYIDPVKDVTVVDGTDSTISVTTVDGTVIVPDSSGVGSTGNVSESGNTSNTFPIPNTDDYPVDSNSNRNTSVDSNITTLDVINSNLRDEIQSDFGVAVRYGDETTNYSINTTSGTIMTTPILNDNEVNKQLNYLKKVLNLYPKGMFQEIKSGGIPLTVLLINNYSDDSITGITDSSYTYANISIAAVHPFEESFYHESYHYIERFLMKRGATFNSWDSFNPVGFSWGTVYNDYSFVNTFSEDSFFVNNYAQTSGAEDRASTFEFMMANSKASCLNYGTTIWKKADYMARTIDYVFNTVNSNTIEYWERFLY